MAHRAMPLPPDQPEPMPAFPVVLGVWDGHDAGAALVVDGKVVAAISEERLTRHKRQGGWPTLAIDAVLQQAGVAPQRVGAVAVAGRYGRAPARWMNQRYAAQDPRGIDPLAVDSRIFAAYQATIAQLPGVRGWERSLGSLALSRQLQQHNLAHAHIALVDHHRAHAHTAAPLLNGDGAVITWDGYGDGVSLAIWTLSGGHLRRVRVAGPGASLALLYGAGTRLLGFAEGEEGKVTGLAAAGCVGAPHAPDFSPVLRDHDWLCRVDLKRATAAMRQALATGCDPADLAAALQAAVVHAAVRVIGTACRDLKVRRLAVAGGLFANVSLNGQLAQLPELDAFAVCPAMGDQGLCVGAALAVGAAFGAGEVADWRLGPAIAGTAGPDPRAVARALARGDLIGVARGRMEFGPRALGNRSILADPRRASVPAELNRRLQRSGFMPFAPMIAAGHWPQAFAFDPTRAVHACRHMVLALPVSQAFAEMAPAVIHLDHTARPQLLDATDDPWLVAVVAAFTALTGCPALLNTSLNLHGEPIVADVAQALACCQGANLDSLVAGDQWRPVVGQANA